MIYQNIFKISISILLIFALGACQENPSAIENEDLETSLQISKEQFNTEQMSFGMIQEHAFEKTIKTTGKIVLPPQHKALIYSAIAGKVKQVIKDFNSNIKKGELLLTVESNAFIQLQQEYLELLAEFSAVENNYNRVKTLFKEKISSQKEFIESESAFLILKAKKEGLKAQLKNLEINTKDLEQGIIQEYLKIYSPIDGVVNEIKINIGQYISPQDQLMSIVDLNGAQLHFMIYSQLVNQVEKGQNINFYSSGSPDIISKSKIKYVGKSVNKEIQGITCVADISHIEGISFIPGMLMQVEVKTSEQRLLSIPNSSLVKSGKSYFVLLQNKEEDNIYYFEKKQVNIGQQEKDFSEILPPLFKGRILNNGSYYFNTEE